MKILIAVSSKEYSSPTLSVGMNVSRAFKASTTIVDVGERISEFSTKDVGMAHERIEHWDFDRPGVDVLEWAFDYLAGKEFIENTDIEAGFPKNTLVDTGGNRCEVYLKGTVCENVSLILRNGDIIGELKDEVQKHDYDVTIIGGSQKRRMAHDLIQYIDSSIFVVNKYDLNQKYKILIAVDQINDNRLHDLLERGKSLGINVYFWGKNKYSTESKESLCPWPFERAVISSDLRTVPCCVISTPDAYEIGKGLSFSKAWLSDEYASFRESHLKGNVPNVCQQCYYKNTTSKTTI